MAPPGAPPVPPAARPGAVPVRDPPPTSPPPEGPPRRGGGSFLLREMAARREEEAEGAVPTVTEIPAWASPLGAKDIVQYPDPRLRAPNAKVGVFDDRLRALAEEMLAVMYEDDGVGLAAPQLGINLRLMVFNEEGDPAQKDKERVLVNPRIVSRSKKTDRGEEGCLSFRDAGGLLLGDVDRARDIRVRAQDLEGRRFELSLAGWTARIFQHEFDHLQGTLLADRFVPESLAAQRGRLVAMEDAFAAAHPGTEIRRLQ